MKKGITVNSKRKNEALIIIWFISLENQKQLELKKRSKNNKYYIYIIYIKTQLLLLHHTIFLASINSIPMKVSKYMCHANKLSPGA
jgi:hypothetical protein